MEKKQRYRFRKAVKIKRDREISHILLNGKKFRIPFLTIYSLKNEFKQSRVAIIIHSKIGPSVDRNRLKRYIRERFRTIQEPILNRDILLKFHSGKGAIKRESVDDALILWYNSQKKEQP